MNALAASDYVLVPTTLGRKSAERVPPMLKRVIRNEQFIRFINPRLRVLGLVANRVYREEMTRPEGAVWNELAEWCRDAYGGEVHRFATAVPDSKEVRESETEFVPAAAEGRLGTLFGQLAAEIEGELPSECRRPAKASS